MAQITNKLVHFEKESSFESRKSDLRNDSIVFVQDARFIQTHGAPYYCGTSEVALKLDLNNYYTKSNIDDKFSSHKVSISNVDGIDSSWIDSLSKTNSSFLVYGNNVLLEGYEKGSDKSDVNSTDSVNTAFAKLQNQIYTKASSMSLEDYLSLDGGTLNGPIQIEQIFSLHNGSETLTIVGGQKELILDQSGLNYNGNIIASKIESNNGFYQTSDINLKNIEGKLLILDNIDKIPTIYFSWKNNINEDTSIDTPVHIGTIAQEIQKIYPDLVTKDKNGNLTVDYSRLSIIAIAAIKELREEIKQLKSKLNE